MGWGALGKRREPLPSTHQRRSWGRVCTSRHRECRPGHAGCCRAEGSGARGAGQGLEEVGQGRAGVGALGKSQRWGWSSTSCAGASNLLVPDGIMKSKKYKMESVTCDFRIQSFFTSASPNCLELDFPIFGLRTLHMFSHPNPGRVCDDAVLVGLN